MGPTPQHHGVETPLLAQVALVLGYWPAVPVYSAAYAAAYASFQSRRVLLSLLKAAEDGPSPYQRDHLNGRLPACP